MKINNKNKKLTKQYYDDIRKLHEKFIISMPDNIEDEIYEDIKKLNLAFGTLRWSLYKKFFS